MQTQSPQKVNGDFQSANYRRGEFTSSRRQTVDDIFSKIDDDAISNLLEEYCANIHARPNLWTETLRRVLLNFSSDVQYLVKVLALSQDNPSWRLLTRVTSQSRVLIVGGSWGNQAEILASEVHSIFIIEPSPTRERFLKERLSGLSTGNVTVSSPAEFLRRSIDLPVFDLMQVRSHFLTGLDEPHLKILLGRCIDKLSLGGELFVETAQRISLPLRIVQRWMPAEWITPAKVRPQMHWWFSYLATQDSLEPAETYYVDGPHWWSRAYYSYRELSTHFSNSVTGRWSSMKSRAFLWILPILIQCGLIPVRAVLLATRRVRSGRSDEAQQISPRRVDNIFKDLEVAGIVAETQSHNSGYRISGNGIATLFFEEPVNVYIRVPVNEIGLRRLNRSHNALTSLFATLPGDLVCRLPLSNRYISKDGSPVYTEAILPGKTHPEFNEAIIEGVIRWIANLHASTLNVVHSPTDQSWCSFGQRRLTRILETVESIVAWYGDAQQHEDWAVVKSFLLNPPMSIGIALCRTHGDLHPRNILTDGQHSSLTGVLDWETSFEDWIPIRDLYYVVVNCLSRSGSRISDTYRCHILESAKAAWLIERYCGLVPDEISRSITHPWSQIIYPLERLQTIVDDYDLFGVVTKEGYAEDLFTILNTLASRVRNNEFRI